MIGLGSIKLWLNNSLSFLDVLGELHDRSIEAPESISVEKSAALSTLASATASRYLTREEKNQIEAQFRCCVLTLNKQVLWTGLDCQQAQKWADERGMQTLSTAMGPLMIKNHDACSKNRKSKNEWSEYIKGASAVFAGLIAYGDTITVLSPPPPSRLHPSGQTNYQTIEEPIVKFRRTNGNSCRIEMVHPLVKGAEDFSYQVWPADETYRWVEQFGLQGEKRNWRSVKGSGKERSSTLPSKSLCRFKASASDGKRKKQERKRKRNKKQKATAAVK